MIDSIKEKFTKITIYVYIFIWIIYIFNQYDIFKKETSSIKLIKISNEEIIWKLHFYNWDYYFIEYENEGRKIKSLINKKNIYEVIYK